MALRTTPPRKAEFWKALEAFEFLWARFRLRSLKTATIWFRVQALFLGLRNMIPTPEAVGLRYHIVEKS